MKRYITALALFMASTAILLAQGSTKGQISSEEGPLPGVTIIEEGTNNGTVTDLEGNFKLNLTTENPVLVISYVGYATQKISYNGETDLGVINLETDLAELEEVVVIGYGTATKKELSSSVSTVKAEDLNRMTVNNVSESLQGLASGVQIINGGGNPGSSPQILIRGVVSNSGTAPLIVVDGIPLQGSNLNFLNPADIKELQVLKDGSAASIYGTRASNGVIIVTTKRGKQGKASISGSASVGLKQLEKPKLADAEEYALVMNERQTNDGNPELWDVANLTNDTDWWEEVYTDFALVQNYNIQINGGSEKMNYLGSIAYFNEDSHLQKGYYERITGRFNVDYSVNDKLTIRQDFNPRFEHWENTPNVFNSTIAIDPLTSVFRPFDEREGLNEYSIYSRSNNTVWNPAAIVKRSFNKTWFYGLFTNTSVTYDITDNFNVSSRLGLNMSNQRNDAFSPEFFIFAGELNEQSRVSSTFNHNFGYVWNNLLNYDQNFGKHAVSATVGAVYEYNQSNWLSGSNTDIILNEPKFRFLNGTTGDAFSASGNESANSLASYLGRFRYNYDGKYYVMAQYRRDGSSRFPASNQWADFYSVSGAWIISDEAFFNVPAVSNLKVKAGLGQVGNQNLPNGAAEFLVGDGDYVLGENEDRVITNAISQFGNPQLTWETVEDINVGVEAGFLDNRITLNVDRYKKKSIGLLFPTDLLLTAGAPSRIWQNVGSFESTGWDIELGYNQQFGELTVAANASINSNVSKAIKLAPGNDRILAARQGNFGNNFLKITEIGGPVGLFYGYEAAGIFQNQTEINSHSDNEGTLIQPTAQPGDLRFVDQNGDGLLNEEDITTIGNPFPDFYSGLNINLGFKNWDFNMQWYGTFGNDVYNFTKSYLASGVSNQNIKSGLYNQVWREDNTDAKYPRLTTIDPNRNYNRSSNFFVEDGTFVRLKNVQLGYNFKVPFASKMRLYVSGQNLLTLTNYSGFDPEVSGNVVSAFGLDYGGVPLTRTFLVGLDVSF